MCRPPCWRVPNSQVRGRQADRGRQAHLPDVRHHPGSILGSQDPEDPE